jgi:hypothetical protein
MMEVKSLDPHQRPPDSIRSLFKKYQKYKENDLHVDPDVIDTWRVKDGLAHQLRPAPDFCLGDRDSAFEEFLSSPVGSPDGTGKAKAAVASAFEVKNLPG